jgi:hypothetical protein
MSKSETWRTREFWKSVGGLLIEEFQAIPASKEKNIGKRVIDGVIVLGVKKGIQAGGKYDIKGKNVIVIQTKSNRLGMSLMGQAFFSREIIKQFHPKSIKTVVIAGKGDSEMEALCKRFNIEVVIIE